MIETTVGVSQVYTKTSYSPFGHWFLHISKEATNSNLHPPTGRVGRGSGRGGAAGFQGNGVVDRPFALPARSSRPSRREGEVSCVEPNARREGEVNYMT